MTVYTPNVVISFENSFFVLHFSATQKMGSCLFSGAMLPKLGGKE